MKYLYESKKNEQIVVEMGMFEDHPGEIEINGEIYERRFTPPQFHIAYHTQTINGKDYEDYQSSKISHGHVKVKSKSGKSYVNAQLVCDKHGEHKLVYKSNPTREVTTKPTNAVIDKLSTNMEKFI